MSNTVRIADSPYAGGVLHKLEEVTERLARINYKIGYSASAEIRYDQVFVIFKAHVVDSRQVIPPATYSGHTLRMVDIQMPVSLPHYVLDAREERIFFTWVRDMLGHLEKHERDEWFRVDGELYEDPHA